LLNRSVRSGKELRAIDVTGRLVRMWNGARLVRVVPLIFVAALIGCGGGGGGGAVPPPPPITPNSIVLHLDRNTVPVGTAATLTLTALAYDGTGTPITTGNFATPVTVAFDDTSGDVTLDKTTLSGPTDAIAVHYSGKLLRSIVTFSISARHDPGIVTLIADPWTRIGPTTYPAIYDLAPGPDGNMWFTECGVLAGATCKLGKITPAGALTEFPDVPYAKNLTAGPDGNVWFTEDTHNFIGRITPGGVVTQYPIPGFNNGGSVPITVGPDQKIWFGEGDRIGVLDPSTGSIVDYPLGGLFRPSSLVVGSDGNLWFTEVQQIGRITTTGAVSHFSVPFGATPPLVATPTGPLYFSLNGPLASISTTGAVNTSSLAQPGIGIVPARGLGPDGQIWGWGGYNNDPASFGAGGGAVRVSLSGTTIVYRAQLPIPFGSTVGVSHASYGPDGNLWFVNGQGFARFRLAY
jgi:streptogramin lyase